MLQAGALLALVGGILVGAPAAAMAADPVVTINISTDIAAGTTTSFKYTITNKNAIGSPADITVSASGMTCGGQCSEVGVQIDPPAPVTRSAKLAAPDVAAGQTKVINLQITVKIGTDSVTATQPLNIHGQDKPKTVRQISGKVKDSTGKAIAGANVGILDSSNRRYETVSNADGGYAFTSSDGKPIGVGNIVVGAAKDGYKAVTVNVQGGADKSINVALTLTSLTASASPSPSASVSASAEASEEATTDPTEDVSPAPTEETQKTSNDSGGGSTLFIILGGLLVAAGIGAIVLVLIRRKNADPDDPDDPDGPGGGGPSGPVPPSQGRYNTPDATRVGGAPVGGLIGGNSNDATMVASLSDAPTMMQRAVPVEDEFPDPYGAPAVTPGNYAGPGGWGTTSAAAAAAGTYGAAPAPAYGANQYGGAPAPAPAADGYEDDGYSGGAGQYGRPQRAEEAYGAYGANQYGGAAPDPQQRFDEPTGMYRPEPGGYGQEYDEPGYGAQPGYDATPGYGQGGEAAGYRGGREPGQGTGAYGGGQGAGAYGGGQGTGAYGGAREPGQGTGAYGGDYRGAEPEYPPAPPSRGGYQGGGYQSGGYTAPEEPESAYGSWNNAPGGGVDGGHAYGPPAGGGEGPAYGQRGGYQGGGGAGSGYGEQQGGYDQRGGYGGYEQGQPGGAHGQPGDYGADPGYYAPEQESGGRHGGQPPRKQPPPPESTHPGQRRSLDWLDD